MSNSSATGGKTKRHWSFIVTDPIFLYPLIIILTIIGLWTALVSGDHSYLARMGNFIIGVGVWMSMRFTLREGINKHKDQSDNFLVLPGSGPLKQLNTNYINNSIFNLGDAYLQIHGFTVVIYGSIIGSWGDKLVPMIKKIFIAAKAILSNQF